MCCNREDLVDQNPCAFADGIEGNAVEVCGIPNFYFVWGETEGSGCSGGGDGSLFGELYLGKNFKDNFFVFEGGVSTDARDDLFGMYNEGCYTVVGEFVVALEAGPFDASRDGEDGTLEAFGVFNRDEGAASVCGLYDKDGIGEGCNQSVALREGSGVCVSSEGIFANDNTAELYDFSCEGAIFLRIEDIEA